MALVYEVRDEQGRTQSFEGFHQIPSDNVSIIHTVFLVALVILDGENWWFKLDDRDIDMAISELGRFFRFQFDVTPYIHVFQRVGLVER